jgi:hypothetical protein
MERIRRMQKNGWRINRIESSNHFFANQRTFSYAGYNNPTLACANGSDSINKRVIEA